MCHMKIKCSPCEYGINDPRAITVVVQFLDVVESILFSSSSPFITCHRIYSRHSSCRVASLSQDLEKLKRKVDGKRLPIEHFSFLVNIIYELQDTKTIDRFRQEMKCGGKIMETNLFKHCFRSMRKLLLQIA